MKKFGNCVTILVLSFVLLIFAVSTSADSAYSTEDDPLVSLSYVENLREEIAEELIDAIGNASLHEYVEDSQYHVLSLKKGQSVNAAGVCEIILRSGSAYVRITSDTNINAGVGFSDVTSGMEITNGISVPKNHCLLASAGDGRNVIVSSDAAYFLVKGDYSIVG